MKNQLIKLALCSAFIFVSFNAIAQMNQLDKKEHDTRGERRGPPPFTQLDIDGDGLITLEEFKQHKIPRGKHEEVFSHIDANGDSAISAQELSDHRPPKHGKGGRDLNDHKSLQ